MASVIVGNGPYDWTLDTDDEGHRNYKVTWQIKTDGAGYGPDHALFAPGLPAPGASLNVGSTVDAWAFYQRKGSARLKNRDKHHSLWLATLEFTTRPARRCQTSAAASPLLEPPRIKGGADAFQREATADKDGKALLSSSGQRLRGPALQIEDGWPTVTVEQNVAWINLPMLAEYRYSVNDSIFWGMAARTVKCKTFDWEQVLYGTCYYYFKVVTTFQLNDKKWDLELLDEGDMVKIPGTTPPKFRRAKDLYEENVHVLLDGSGNALAPGADPVYLTKRVLPEKNFAAVGWPVTIL